MDDIKRLWPKVLRLEDAAEAGGMGRTTPRPPIVYDGSGTELIELMGEGVTYVKISDEPVSLNDVTVIRTVSQLNDEIIGDYGKEDFSVMSQDGVDLLLLNALGTPYVIVVNENVDFGDGATLAKGTYIIDYFYEEKGQHLYVSRIEFEETIHPIDPKFLPGGVSKTIIDMADYGIDLQALCFAAAVSGGAVRFTYDHILDEFWERVEAAKDNLLIRASNQQGSIVMHFPAGVSYSATGAYSVSFMSPAEFSDEALVVFHFIMMRNQVDGKTTATTLGLTVTQHPYGEST